MNDEQVWQTPILFITLQLYGNLSQLKVVGFNWNPVKHFWQLLDDPLA